VLGLLFALLLNAKTKGQPLLRSAVLVPWAIPTVVSARLWARVFDPEVGFLRGWLSSPIRAMHAAIAVDVWKTTPFVALILLAGLKAIPQDVYRAARVDGAGPLRTLWSITLPLLRPAI